MPSWFDIGNIWKNLREVDLRPIRAEAERAVCIAIVGDDGSAKAGLINSLCQESRRKLPEGDASRTGPDPVNLDLDQASSGVDADLIVLIVDATKEDQSKERELVQKWQAAGGRVVVVNTRTDQARGLGKSAWEGAVRLDGSTADYGFLEREFVPAVLAMVPAYHLSLARYYPLFRVQVAQQLIAETSATNASYALSTGLAEIIPILDVPFNVADMIVLTKAQAIMAYKLGLALGLSARWQDHMTAFGGTIGSGFLWRQLARQLVGLVPVWGIVPKVAVSYAGTYVLGQAILQWYLTGRQVTPAVMRQLYRDAFDQGKAMARALVRRAPRREEKRRLLSRGKQICANCGGENPGEHNYCGNCGSPLKVES
jgi:uncharacterized protein (DUF697 family)